MADLDLEAVRDVMVSVAYEAGAMMLAANPADIDQGTKLNCKTLTKDRLP
jgi:myo-inositol-1(or 4)-monophosphatase